jgi:perosamine synthetase
VHLSLRHQLPAYSPVPLSAGARAAAAWLRRAADRRPALLAALAAEHGASGGALYGSGTQALQRALEAAVGRGGTVALPAFACFDLAAAAVGAGVRVALYDVDPATLGPDPDSLRRALASGARTLVLAPLFGMAAGWEDAMAAASRAGAAVVVDAAQGHGAAWSGRSLAGWGDLAVLSFGRGKGWTGGGGGALLWRGAWRDLAEPPRVVGMRAEAVALAAVTVQWALGRPGVYGLPRALPGLSLGETVYHPPRPPVRLARASASVLELTRGRADDEACARRDNAAALLGRLAGAAGVSAIHPDAACTPGYLLLPLRLAGGLERLADPARAMRLGIARGYPHPLSELPALAPLLVDGDRCYPGAASLARELVTLPTHSRVTAADRAEIVRLLCDPQ